MPVQVTFDPAIKRLSEPGYQQYFPARQLVDQATPADAASQRGFWADPVTGTLMLMPLNIRPDWINTSGQLSSIIRLNVDSGSGFQFGAHPDDIADGLVFEANIHGNTSNPWLHHAPTGPSAFTPFTGLNTIPKVDQIEPLLDFPLSLVGTAPGAPGAASDGRFICETKTRLPANQGFYVRWHNPESKIGHQTAYCFMFGQYALMVRDYLLEVFRDNSASGDRSSWVSVTSVPLYSTGEFRQTLNDATFARHVPGETGPHDRGLLILPFRRTQVLLLSTTGQSVLFQARSATSPQRILDDDTADPTDQIYNITRSDTFVVWALTPAPGHFQVQRLRFKEGPVVLNLPHVILHYTPATLPSPTFNKDSDKGTSVTGALTEPPGYTVPVNDADDCPAETSGASGQSRTYGITVTLNSESTQRWTPFLYGVTLAKDPTFVLPTTTPTTFNDTAATTARIRRAGVSLGLDPGDGSADLELVDESPFTLASYYDRSRMPLQILLTGTACFTGLSEPHEMQPIKLGALRHLRIRAVDRWKELVDAYLRDQRDWTGFGHIAVVLFVAQQAGIDTTGADTYAVGSSQDTALGGLEVTSAQTSRLLNPGWQPKLGERAAEFIKRIADEYSGWMVGFHADGTFFYRPREFYTTTAITFYQTRAEAIANGAPTAPLCRANEEPEFRTLEPEANVVQFIAASATTGRVRASSVFIDFASIQNPAVVNYIGAWKPLVRIYPRAVFTCAELNRMARVTFDRVRRRRRFIQFKGDYVPTLKLGQIVTLFGYGNVRLQKIRWQSLKDTIEFAVYDGERVEAGHGLP